MKKITFACIAFLAFSFGVSSQESIQTAIEKTDARFVKEWIQSGHDVNGIITINDQQMTALSYAALKANPEMVNLLLNKGAQAQLKVNFEDALMFAAIGGNLEVIEALLAAGANPLNENKMGKCARDLAKDYHNMDAHRVLSSETDKRIAIIRLQKKK